MEQPTPGVQEQPATPMTQLDGVVEPTYSETDSDGLKKVVEADNLPVVPICSEEDGLKKDGEIESVNTVPGSGTASPQKASMLDGKVEMTPAQLRAFRNEGLRVVIGGMLIHLVLGTFYLWGSVSVYVASYLKSYDDSITVKLVQLVFPFIKIATNLTMPFGVKLSQRFGPRKVCLSGIIVIAIAVFCTSFIHNFAGVLIVYGLGFGFASGITFVTPVACGWKYFPHRKGVANGAIIGAFGFGTFIFNYVALAIVNPHNEKATHKINGTKYFTEDIYSKVPDMYKVLAGCYLVLGTIGSLMLKDPKITPSNLGPAPQAAKAGQKKDAKPKQIAETLGEGLRTPSYWILVCITTCAAFFGFMLANNYKVYGMTTIADDLFLTTVGSVGSACKGLARFFWSTMMDKFGFKKVFLLLVFIQCVCCGTFIPISHNKACFLIWYIVAMSAEEAAIIPTITAQIFWTKVKPEVLSHINLIIRKSSLIYPFVYAGFSIATLSSFFLTYGSLSWPAVFWISFSFSAVCAVLVLMLNETPRFRKEKPAVKIQDPEQPTTPVEEKPMPDNVFVHEEQIILNDLDHIIPEEGGMKKVKDVGINDQKAF